MTTDISVSYRWADPSHQPEPEEFEYDGGNSSSRLYERSRIRALAGLFMFLFNLIFHKIIVCLNCCLLNGLSKLNNPVVTTPRINSGLVGWLKSLERLSTIRQHCQKYHLISLRQISISKRAIPLLCTIFCVKVSSVALRSRPKSRASLSYRSPITSG